MVKIEENRILKAFPKCLEKEVLKVCNIIPKKTKYKFELVSKRNYTINFQNESLHIFSRIYFEEANSSNLSEKEKRILYCIYTRHYNGFIREKYLRKLENITESWQIPFIVQLLGEYVEELFPIISELINERNIKLFKKFLEENKIYAKQTESRIASYWGEYYRNKYHCFCDYPARKIFDRLKTNT